MGKLKQNTITLVKEVKDGEVVTETFVTPVFIPMSVVYEAMDIMDQNEEEDENVSQREIMDKLMTFVADKIYAGAFTKDQLLNGLHAPDAIASLQNQIKFVAQGEQTNETKEFLEKKR